LFYVKRFVVFYVKRFVVMKFCGPYASATPPVLKLLSMSGARYASATPPDVRRGYASP
jgi:hypothetical protein